MSDITSEAKRIIVQQKLDFWENTKYALTIDAEIAQLIGDTQMLENTKTQLKNTLQAIDTLNKKALALSATVRGE